ncbi:ImmA/IrrE family metallo-endopeptidase [Paenirhodobacter hankyongi]|uniref:ImmA/IrrE family metallo-endopeptidase n=1 Tax=Paenirhodobacter hankyongi TaxID=2294033 RepID=A0A421BQP4_9RHOB|nr:ImmA/IrrE family metallo-endopeptidase [Sinirhodobacter hankyongi]RLL65273.1 ImmA/IrrE family metallo-endopeptidase [Sinirhodobacter hankyongi]
MLDTIPGRVRWDVAKAKADSLTCKFERPPIPVRAIAEGTGVDVVFADFGKHSNSVAGFCDFRGERLYVNRDDKPERQTFTIAHELGHWLLHKELFERSPDAYAVLPRHAVANNRSVLEKEANHFAAHLLVPSRLLRPVMRASTVSSLAEAFGVSYTMMSFRVANEER